MEKEKTYGNQELDIQEVNVYTSDCGTTKYSCTTDCFSISCLITCAE